MQLPLLASPWTVRKPMVLKGIIFSSSLEWLEQELPELRHNHFEVIGKTTYRRLPNKCLPLALFEAIACKLLGHENRNPVRQSGFTSYERRPDRPNQDISVEIEKT